MYLHGTDTKVMSTFILIPFENFNVDNFPYNIVTCIN